MTRASRQRRQAYFLKSTLCPEFYTRNTRALTFHNLFFSEKKLRACEARLREYEEVDGKRGGGGGGGADTARLRRAVAELEKSLEATGELLRESEVARERAEAKGRSRARALEEVVSSEQYTHTHTHTHTHTFIHTLYVHTHTHTYTHR